MTASSEHATTMPAATLEYVVIHLEDQCFGLAIEGVHDVFVANGLTPVPLAPKDVAGLLNLRGRVVTAVSLRSRLGLEPRADSPDGAMIVGLERCGDSYGLVVDSVGEVVSVPATSLQSLPCNFDPLWADLSLGVHQLESRLMVVLDIDAVLDLPAGSATSAPNIVFRSKVTSP